MLVVNEPNAADVVVVKMSGIVTAGEVDAALAQLGRLFEERRSLRFYVELIGFERIELAAAMREAAFFARHRRDTDRAAIVAAEPGERAAGWFVELFMGGETREFPAAARAEAMAWLAGGTGPE